MPYKDPEKRREVKRKWREKNGTEYARKYRTKHKDKINKNQRKYYAGNKKKVNAASNKWIKENPKARAAMRKKCDARRRRNLGYKPINKKETGNAGHHIDKNLVIFIPEELHKLVYHSQGDLMTMKEINILAIQVAYI